MSESSPKKRPKAPVRIDVSRAVKMLADARELGVTAAAKRHRVTTRTIRRYRALLRTDVELQTQYAALIELQDKTWVSERAKSLRCAAERAQVLLAKEDDLDKITRYIEKVGGVDVVAGELNNNAGDSGAVGQGSAPPSLEGEESEGAPEVH